MSKFTRSHIRATLEASGLEAHQARELTGRIIEALAAAIIAGEVIEFRGLGTFEIRERKARRAHNPRTLAPVDVPARRTVYFRPCGKLKAALREQAPEAGKACPGPDLKSP
jgi:nucleoid DNA-binding protein